MTDPNPYEPTLYGDSVEQNPPRRRTVLAVIASVVGMVCAVLGLLVLAETIQIAARQRFDAEIVYGLVAGAIFLAFGAAWIAAAWLLWRQRSRLVGSLTALALIISLLVFAYLIFK